MTIKYYSGNRLTGVSGDTKPTTLPTGSTFLETNTDDLYLWDGDSWNVVASNTGTEILSNKSFSDSLVFDEISVPGNAATDKVRLYAKSGGRVYSKDDSGNEFDLTAGAGSTSTISGASDTDITSAASAHVLIYDGSNSWDNKAVSGDVTIAATGATTLGSVVITGQSAEATVNNSNDLVLIYDGSAGALKKMTVANLVAGGVSSDSLSSLTDTTIASVASAQVLIYDGTDSWDNKTVSGDVTISASGVTAIGSGVVVNADVNASAAIDYSKLAALTDGNILVGNGSNVAVSVNPSGDVDITNAGVFSIAAGVIVNADVNSSAAIAISKTALVAGTGITLATNTLNVDVAQTQITSVGALNAGSITSGFGAIDTGSSNITTTGTISTGNLTVTGTTTTVNSTVLTVVDPIIHLQTASGGGALSADTNKDVGLAMQYYSGSAKTAFLGFDDSAVKLTFIPDATLSSEVVSGSIGTIVANLEGAVAGNATTATTLATARTIGGTSFNGSANIAVALAATATELANARTVGGVSFNGTANINLPGVNTTGNQNTSGTAANVTGTVLIGTGGTGLTSYTAGDILYYVSGTTLTKLAKGNAAEVLTMNSGATAPEWAASSSSGASESFAIAMAVAL